MRSVLLVEDNKLNQIVAGRTLRRLGYTVDIVDHGSDAIEACINSTFDAVLMDIMMPGVDGYEAATRIRANEAQMGSRVTPIIGLSARAMDGDREIALDAGMVDYLTKPLRADLLDAALQRWIGAPLAPA